MSNTTKVTISAKHHAILKRLSIKLNVTMKSLLEYALYKNLKTPEEFQEAINKNPHFKTINEYKSLSA